MPFVPPDKVDTIRPGPLSRHASWLEYRTKGEDDSFPDHSAAIDSIHVLIRIELLSEYSSETKRYEERDYVMC